MRLGPTFDTTEEPHVAPITLGAIAVETFIRANGGTEIEMPDIQRIRNVLNSGDVVWLTYNERTGAPKSCFLTDDDGLDRLRGVNSSNITYAFSLSQAAFRAYQMQAERDRPGEDLPRSPRSGYIRERNFERRGINEES